jgi:hypothetical protein
VEKLREQGYVSEAWWDTYRSRQIETKEASSAERKQRNKKVIALPGFVIRKSKKVRA